MGLWKYIFYTNHRQWTRNKKELSATINCLTPNSGPLTIHFLRESPTLLFRYLELANQGKFSKPVFTTLPIFISNYLLSMEQLIIATACANLICIFTVWVLSVSLFIVDKIKIKLTEYKRIQQNHP